MLSIELGHSVKRVTLLGSTGTIGVNTLDVLARHSDKFQVFALTANGNYQRLVEHCERFKPAYIVLSDEVHLEPCRALLETKGLASRLLCGAAALEQVASHRDTDIVMAAIVGDGNVGPGIGRNGRGVVELLVIPAVADAEPDGAGGRARC